MSKIVNMLNELQQKRLPPTPTAGAIFTKYELGQTLGTGAFSEVKVATERESGRQYAIKIIDKSKCKGKEGMIETEVNILKRVQHEHVIQLYEMYEVENKIYLVMELVTGGELFDDIVGRGKYTEGDAARIVQKMLLAIDYLHAMGIAHRDLKPENLLLSDKSRNAKIMISDFGLSKIFNEDETMKTACGTPGYVAPEVLKRQGYSKEVDLWSIGVITYILLCGYPPFYDQNNVELFKQIMAGKYEFDRPWWDNISEQAKDFIRKLLVLNPRERYTAKQALRHPFIVSNCGAPDFVKNGSAVPAPPIPKEHASSLAPPKSGIPQPVHRPAVAAKDIRIPIPPPCPHHQHHQQVQQKTPLQTNLAPVVKTNLQKVYSSRNSMKNMAEAAGADRVGIIDCNHAAADNSWGLPKARPIAEKGQADDSGIVSSRGNFDIEAYNKLVSDAFSKRVKSIQSEKGDSPHPNNNDSSDQSRANGTLSNNPVSTLQSAFPPHSTSLTGTKSVRSFATFTAPQVVPNVNSLKIDSEPAKSVRFLSYNIFMRPPGIKNNSSDYKNARLDHIGNDVLKNYDIVCLQEMFSYGSSRQLRMMSYAKKAGLPYIVTSPSKGVLNAMIDGGLMICSRYPIVETARMTYKRGVHSDRFSAKGALYAKVAVGGGHYMHVFTTHLQSSYDANITLSEPSVIIRLQQLCMLKEFVDECTKRRQKKEPIVILGDMNVNSRRTKENGRQDSDEFAIMSKILRGEMNFNELATHYGHSVSSSTSNLNNINNAEMIVLDVMAESLGEHPITYGDVTDFVTKSPKETVLTAIDGLASCGSIDYIFSLIPLRDYESGLYEVNKKLTKVEPFFVNGEPFTQLSDHYGISATFSLSDY